MNWLMAPYGCNILPQRQTPSSVLTSFQSRVDVLPPPRRRISEVLDLLCAIRSLCFIIRSNPYRSTAVQSPSPERQEVFPFEIVVRGDLKDMKPDCVEQRSPRDISL